MYDYTQTQINNSQQTILNKNFSKQDYQIDTNNSIMMHNYFYSTDPIII